LPRCGDYKVEAIEILEPEQVRLHWSCQIFWGKTHCKKLADLHPRQGNLLKKKNIFQGPVAPRISMGEAFKLAAGKNTKSIGITGLARDSGLETQHADLETFKIRLNGLSNLPAFVLTRVIDSI
jgi:hypothetical protein